MNYGICVCVYQVSVVYYMCREEMVSLEHRLLLNAVERQRHTATVRFSGKISTPSPLPPSSLSPLPTTLEDTGQASLLFERLPNWFSEPCHMMTSEPLEDVVTSQDSHMITMVTTQSDHMTTAEESISPPCDHMTAGEQSHDDHMTSPDSVAPAVEVTVGSVMVGSVRVEEESEEACLARTELAGLQMDRRRLEARHRRLGRKLMEIRTKKSQLQKVFETPNIVTTPHTHSLTEGVGGQEAPPPPGRAVCGSAVVCGPGGGREAEGAGRSSGLTAAGSQRGHPPGTAGAQPPTDCCSTTVPVPTGRLVP